MRTGWPHVTCPGHPEGLHWFNAPCRGAGSGRASTFRPTRHPARALLCAPGAWRCDGPPPGGPGAPAAGATATRPSSEANLGRYILSVASALLVVLAAVSLVALVWDKIPNAAKIGALGLVAVSLTGAGTWLASARPRVRVAAATMTGTGGALGFMAVLGGVLLDGLLPVYPAFGLMALWSFTLMLVSHRVAQVFTAVVSTIGAVIAICFASWYAFSGGAPAPVVWSLVSAYPVGLGAMTVFLSRSRASGKWAPGTRLPHWCQPRPHWSSPR